MSISSQLQPLLLQFQSRYPLGGLCSELLVIHQNQYVVRAFVQVSGMTLATAMTAAPDLEVAEDRAKLRVLEGLGLTSSNLSTIQAPMAVAPMTIGSSIPAVPSTLDRFNRLSSLSANNSANNFTESSTKDISQTSELPSPQLEPLPVQQVAQSATHTSDPAESSTAGTATELLTSPPANSWTSPSTDQFDHNIDHDSDSHLAEALVEERVPVEVGGGSLPISQPVSQPVSQPSQPEAKSPEAKSKASKRNKTEPATSSVESSTPATAAAQPADHSQEIMRIGIEMKRLGWSTEQGREYLKRTYGKRSRQELDDAELLDFLHHLEAQSSLQTPF
jgi:hypothetical protein